MTQGVEFAKENADSFIYDSEKNKNSVDSNGVKGYDKSNTNIVKLKYKPSSGIEIKSDPTKTTTILGSFKKDTQYILKELNLPKSTNFDKNPGEFNMLNTPDNLYFELGPDGFWEKYNKPFIDAAIKRGDNIILATKPKKRYLYNRRNGQMKGFGREYYYLEENGYIYYNNSMILKKEKE